MSPALALLVLSSLFACGAGKESGVSSASEAASIRAAAQAAAHALARFYEAANDGADEAYTSRALAKRAHTGAAERCRLPSGALSTRPTVLANPVLAHSSVLQREKLVLTLGAYEAMLVTMSNNAASPDVAVAESDLQRELLGLTAAANTHAQGDLFLEDAAKALTHEFGRLAHGGDQAEQMRVVNAADVIVRKLIAILSTDVARQRVDTVDAASLAYQGWLSYGRSTRAASHSAQGGVETDPPFCSEPAIYARARSHAESNSEESPAARGLIGVRIVRARERLDAVRRADPAAVVSALAALDDNEIRVLTSAATSESMDATRTSIERFKTVAGDFATAVHKPDMNSHAP